MLSRTLARRIRVFTTLHVAATPSRPDSHGQHPSHPPLLKHNRRLRFQSSSPTSTSSHHDLPTFLTYADRTGLDRASTIYTGTYYEYLTQTLLSNYGFSLTRVGGRGDRGVDLKGRWEVCTSDSTKVSSQEDGSNTSENGGAEKETQNTVPRFSLPVIIQCKRLKAKVGPNLIRELEGALAGKTNTLGVLVGTRGATKGVREAMGRSRAGVVWVCLEGEGDELAEERGDGKESEEKESDAEEEQKAPVGGFDDILQTMKSEIESKMEGVIGGEKATEEEKPGKASPPPKDRLGRVRQILWNQTASDMGLQGLDVVMKYDGTRDANGEVGKEVVLMWQGKSVIGVDPEVDEMK